MNLKEFNAENGISVLVQYELGGDMPRALLHGVNLFQNGIVPKVIITGMGEIERTEGSRIAEGIKTLSFFHIPILKLPAVTEPCFSLFGVGNNWHCLEPLQLFASRINAAIFEQYQQGEPVLFNLCKEAVVLMYYEKLRGFMPEQIWPQENIWVAKRGGGIVFSQGFNIAREFLPDFTIVE